MGYFPVLFPSRRKFKITKIPNLGFYHRSDRVKSNAANHFTAANNEFFNIADNADLSFNGTDFTVAAFVKLDSLATTQTIMSKRADATTVEFTLVYNSGANRFQFAVHNGIGFTIVAADNFGAPSIGVWYSVVARCNLVAQKVYIQVNNGTPNELAFTSSIPSTNSNFRMGAQKSGASVDFFWNGLIDSAVVWKRVLTASERTAYHNGGVAPAMAEITAHATLNDAVAGWGLNTAYGQADDSFGANHLTNNNTVEAVLGNGAELDPSDRWAVTKQNDQTANGRDFTATAKASIPSYEVGEINGLPVIRYDGVNDISSTPDFADVGNGNTEISVFMVIRGTAVTNRHILAHWDTNSQRSWVLGKGNANNAKMRVQLSGNGTTVGKDYESSTTVFGDSNPHIVGFTYDGTTLSTYVDSKTAEASPTKTVDAATPTLHNSTAAITEGASLATGVGQLYASFDLAEKVIKNAKLSVGQINDLMAFWSAKYGITLS
jgi:hypothetical protein